MMFLYSKNDKKKKEEAWFLWAGQHCDWQVTTIYNRTVFVLASANRIWCQIIKMIINTWLADV